MTFTAEAGAEDNIVNREADFRYGWVGAQHVAMGRAAEVVQDDLFLIYWNPAGLNRLLDLKEFPSFDNSGDGSSGSDNNISEDDLLTFSEEEEEITQLGASASFIDGGRKDLFLGAAFEGLKGIIGTALYAFYLNDLEADKGEIRPVDDSDAFGSAAYISYALEYGVFSAGFSLKALYEKIGQYKFYGFGTDAAAVIEPVPFVRAGLVIQDLVTAFRPGKDYEYIEDDIEFSDPAVKFSAAVSGILDFTLSFTGIRIIGEGNEFNYGIKYDILQAASLYIGLSDYSWASTGFSYGFPGGEAAYCFSYHIDDKECVSIISINAEL